NNDKIMSNYYIRIIFNLTLITAYIYAIKDILLKIKEIIKKGEKFKVIKIILYILLILVFVLLFVDFSISSILNLIQVS
ncbi:hypothetical protein DP145_13495, partial [Clostridium tetani]|uniref:hypothetical protein n=1 Tax=Clostridium tetani TaxID=1513 RepID=UPI00100AD6DA